MNVEVQNPLEQLDGKVRALAEAASPGEVFKALLDGIRLAGPRGAVLLIRQGRIKAWGSFGYDDGAAAKLRGFDAALDEDWATALLLDSALPPALWTGSDLRPDFGQPEPAEGAGVLVRVKGRPIALVMIERGLAEGPWFPRTISWLATVAQLRLDLDLALRKLREGQPEAARVAPQPRSTEPRLAPIVDPLQRDKMTGSASGETARGIAPLVDAEAPEDPRVQAARRFARLVATDIKLYHEEAVVLGRQHGDLVARLGDQFGRGKEVFLRRHPALGAQGLEILHEAFINVLAGGDAKLVPRSVLD